MILEFDFAWRLVMWVHVYGWAIVGLNTNA